MKNLNTNRNLLAADEAICEQISELGAFSRGRVSKNILSHLRNFVEHLMVAIFFDASEFSNKDKGKIIHEAKERAKKTPGMKDLTELHDLLQKSVSHFTFDDDSSERLFLKYYPYLYRIRELIKDSYGIELLKNLQDYPLDIDDDNRQYYASVAHCLEDLETSTRSKTDRFYIKKMKPFLVDGKLYYELTLGPAVDRTSKFDHLVAYTDIFINTFYAVEIEFVLSKVTMFDTSVAVTLIKSWKVAIRKCECSNFTKTLLGPGVEVTSREHKGINEYLSVSRNSLLDVVLNDEAYRDFKTKIMISGQVHHFVDALDKCRTTISSNGPGSNVLRYMLLTMNNSVIKAQQNRVKGEDRSYHLSKNPFFSNYYLNNGCRLFDLMPYYFSLCKHNPRRMVLMRCIPLSGHEDELFARFIRRNTEENCRLKTSVKECLRNEFENIDELISSFNSKLVYDGVKNQRIVHEGTSVYITSYVENTAWILRKLKEESSRPVTNYQKYLKNILEDRSINIDDDNKFKILNSLFLTSHVALIYGSAGTGKTYLMELINKVFGSNEKVYIAQTNPAVSNLKRRISSNGTARFMTVESYKKTKFTEKHILLMDEASTVSNEDMKIILEKASYYALVLVGDTHQIASIRFGNWFALAEHILDPSCVHRLDVPYRAKGTPLIELWELVREMEPGIKECMAHGNYCRKLDRSVFNPISDDEILLCLNYDGQYGINYINKFMQASEKDKIVDWQGKTYKVGDPVLFFENERFGKILYNNLKGKILDVNTDTKPNGVVYIAFTIEVNAPLTEFDALRGMRVFESKSDGKSIVEFSVDGQRNCDEEEANNLMTIVPFEVAYAVSIHKAQGLQYESVKVILAKETEEKITHNIFYTAITRSTKYLTIYWSPETEQSVLSTIKPSEIKKDVGFVKRVLENYSNYF